MRIPRSPLHSKVFDLIRYLNTHGSLEDKIEPIPYILEHENNLCFFQGQKGSLHDRCWAISAGLPEDYHGKTPRQLLGEVNSAVADFTATKLRGWFRETTRL